MFTGSSSSTGLTGPTAYIGYTMFTEVNKFTELTAINEFTMFIEFLDSQNLVTVPSLIGPLPFLGLLCLLVIRSLLGLLIL